jgi:hypothetical protein
MTNIAPRLAGLCAALMMIALGGCAHAARPGCSGDIPTLLEYAAPAVVMISAQSINARPERPLLPGDLPAEQAPKVGQSVVDSS